MRRLQICFSLEEHFDFTSTKTICHSAYTAFLSLNSDYLLMMLLDELSGSSTSKVFASIPLIKKKCLF